MCKGWFILVKSKKNNILILFVGIIVLMGCFCYEKRAYAVEYKEGDVTYTYTDIDSESVCITGVKGNVTGITIPSSIAGKKVTKIGSGAFFENTSLQSVTIPSTVTVIDDMAFSECSALKEVSLGNGLINIGEYAFQGCISLEKITIPDTVTDILEGAFLGCKKLSDISVGKKVKNIGFMAFLDCNSLEEIYLPSSLESIEDYAFGYYYEAGSLKKDSLFIIKGEVSSNAKKYADNNGFTYISAKNNEPYLLYVTHAQSYGWLNYVSDGNTSGTIGKSKRLEAVRIRLVSTDNLMGGIEYSSHVQSIGWQGYVSDGEISGTEGKSLRVEAIKIRLTGDISNSYDVYYRVHAQTFGWMGWTKNGEMAGSSGYAKRLEAIEIKLVKKGVEVYEDSVSSYRDKSLDEKVRNINPTISYRVHVQSYGWMDYVQNGEMAGTSGKAKRLEAINISVSDLSGITGGIEYKVHVQTYGWMDYVKNGEMAGTSGKAKRLEGIKIRLTGTLANYFNVHYRTHVQKFGWLSYTINGRPSGSEGYAYRLEAINIKLVRKEDDSFTLVNENNSFLKK